MASTYVNDLRLEEQATGENSGSWGTKLNSSLEQIAEAFSYGSEAIADASTHTITMADGTSDEARSLYLKCTGGGQACTVTLAPNTVSKVWMIENATSYTLTFSQGTGANVAVAAGEVKMIATDGAGSGAVVYDLLTDTNLAGTTKVAALTASGAVTANAGVSVDNITIDGTEIDLSSGDLTIDVAGDITLDADGGDWKFADGGTDIGQFINSSSDFKIRSVVQDKDLIFEGNDGGSTITPLKFDMSAGGIATFTSAGNSPVIIQSTHGTGGYVELQLSDSGGAGSLTGYIGDSEALIASGTAADLAIRAQANFVVSTGGSTQRFKIDSSGNANMPDSGKFTFGAGTDLEIYHDGDDSYISDSGTGNLLISSSDLYLRNAANNETTARFTDGGAVKLYYDNTERLATTSSGVSISGALSKSSGSFKIDHPLADKKDTHHLVHGFVESPQANNIYRGEVTLSNGSASVNIDAVSNMSEGTFVALNTEIHCFTTNESDWDAVKGSVSDNVLSISCQNPNSTAKVSWLVIGERQDAHMKDELNKTTNSDGKLIVEPLKENE